MNINNLEDALECYLEAAKASNRQYAPLMVVAGLSGFGKTARVKSWCEENNLKTVNIDAASCHVNQVEVEYSSLNSLFTDSTIVASEELEYLMTPKKNVVNVMLDSQTLDSIDGETVLVIDNYDRATLDVRNEWCMFFDYSTFTR